MTTVVANSSGRSGGGKPVRKNQSSNVSHSVGNQATQKDNEKFQPTAEQMRIANLMSDKKDADSDLKPKIDQIVELTGATRDDAAIALHDCDNDMAKAIERILDGETLESEWRSTGKKKKQKNISASNSIGTNVEQTSSTNVNGQKNGEDRKFDKPRRERANGFEENGSGEFKSVENGRSQRGKRDSNFKPRGERRVGSYASNNSGSSRPQENEDLSEERDDRHNGDGNSSRRGGFNGRGRGGGVAGRGRGAPRGRGSGRGGARNYGSRGPLNSDKPADEFLGSIDTWTNEPKSEESVSTMKVGNWSDISGQEWTSDTWTESTESKVFNMNSDKNTSTTIPETQKPVANAPTQMSFLSAASKSIEKENQQPPSAQSSNFASVASAPTMKRPEATQQSQHSQQQPSHATSQQQQQQQSQSSQQPQQTQVTAGRALLNQIQQPQHQQQQPNLKQQASGPGLGINMYNKNATESIKSLVGLSGSAIGESLSGDISKQMASNSRLKPNVQAQRAKPTESAVEMPISNEISNVALCFGSLDFNNSGTNPQPSFSNISSTQENVFEQTPQKSEKNLNSLMDQNQQNQNAAYRSSTTSGQKNVLPVLNDVLNVDKINIGQSTYSKKTDFNMMNYGKNFNSEGYNSAAPGYNQHHPQQLQQQHIQPNYYLNNFNSGNFNSSTYGNSSVNSVSVAQQQVVKESGVSQQSVVPSVSANATSSAPNSMGLMSNSTNTTNVLKNTLSATGKGVHSNNNASMPPGVQNYPQAPISMAGNFITNNGVPVPFLQSFPFDHLSQFRDGAYPSYGPDIQKFNRSEADMNSASSQANVGVPSIAGQQGAHSHSFVNFNSMMQFLPYHYSPSGPLFNTAQYPQAYPMPQTTVANSNFSGKASAQSYNQHSYAAQASYDNLGGNSVPSANSGPGGVVNQTQDYIPKPSYGSQQMAHTKAMQSSNSGSDLTGPNQNNTNGQQMSYKQTHSQMNKNYDKQNSYQPNNQYIGGNNGLGGYGANFILSQQQMHMGGDQQGSQQPGVGGGAQRTLKGNANNSKFMWG